MYKYEYDAYITVHCTYCIYDALNKKGLYNTVHILYVCMHILCYVLSIIYFMFKYVYRTMPLKSVRVIHNYAQCYILALCT
jgi:hypothetical protein